MALQSIVEGGMEKRAFTAAELAAAAALLPGAGATAAALGSKDHKTLSGILGAGVGAVTGYPGHVLSFTAMEKLNNLADKVKNPKLKAVLEVLSPVAALAAKTGAPAGAGYGTGKLVDWIADKIG